MAKKSQVDILPPNNPQGFHQRRGERIERKCIEIGKGKFQDFITDCTLVDCDVRIHCGAGSVNLFGSAFERCVFYPRREMKNLRFTSMVLRNCKFLGKYTGCRFGRELEEQAAEIRDCDFSAASHFHLCDFLDGADVASLRWPSWPHFVVTDLPRSRREWLRLDLPPALRLTQQVIGSEVSTAHAVSVYLPAEMDDVERVHDLLSSQSYVIIAEPGTGC